MADNRQRGINDMQVRELIQVLETIAPPVYGCDWDNIGLMFGRGSDEVHNIYIALDATDETIEAAEARGCDFLLTHHPLLFEAVRRIDETTLAGRRLLRLAECKMACYGMHTSFDAAPGAMGDLAAERLGIKETVPMMVTEAPGGIGRLGCRDTPVSLRDFCGQVKRAFALPAVTLYDGGEPDRLISKIAVLPGSGKGEAELALSMGAEVYVTGDMTHHAALDAVAQGLAVIDAGHYGLEWVFIPHMETILKRELPETIGVYGAPVQIPGCVII